MTSTTATTPVPVPTTAAFRFALGVSDCRTLIGRQLRHLMRDPEQFIQTVSVPIILLLMFRYLLGGAIRTDGQTYINYVVAGLIVLSSGFSLTSTVVGVTDDLSNGIVERFRSMPVLATAPLVAHVVVAVLRNTLSAVVLVLVGLAVGLRPHASALEALAAVGILLLFFVSVAWVAVILGVIARSSESATGLSMLLLFAPYASSAVVPTSTMPHELGTIVRYQPFTPVIDAIRALLNHTPVGNAWWVALAWWGTILVLSLPLAVRALARRFAA
jgi:ABC-2 type transport system permease protein